MNLKELIKEVDRLKRQSHKYVLQSLKDDITLKQGGPVPLKGTMENIDIQTELRGIRQTIEAVDNHCFTCLRDHMTKEFFQDWQTLKKLLEVE